MDKISALTFAYNEESCIEKSLESIKGYVDEIVVFDLESTDKTHEIALKYTDKVFRVPYVLCGDGYKNDLVSRSSGDWVLWFYSDEVFPQRTAEAFRKIVTVDRWNAFSFMRHEYMNGVRLNYMKDGRKVEHGTPESPNYQIRLHRRGKGIYYTELVHAELHGDNKPNCGLPPEFYFEHQKTSGDQDFDNLRTYVVMKQLIWKYKDTRVAEYKKFIDSYKQIVRDSEALNLSGERKIHLAEEFWWDWRKFVHMGRISLEEFNAIVGMEYGLFLKGKEYKEDQG